MRAQVLLHLAYKWSFFLLFWGTFLGPMAEAQTPSARGAVRSRVPPQAMGWMAAGAATTPEKGPEEIEIFESLGLYSPWVSELDSQAGPILEAFELKRIEYYSRLWFYYLHDRRVESWEGPGFLDLASEVFRRAVDLVNQGCRAHQIRGEKICIAPGSVFFSERPLFGVEISPTKKATVWKVPADTMIDLALIANGEVESAQDQERILGRVSVLVAQGLAQQIFDNLGPRLKSQWQERLKREYRDVQKARGLKGEELGYSAQAHRFSAILIPGAQTSLDVPFNVKWENYRAGLKRRIHTRIDRALLAGDSWKLIAGAKTYDVRFHTLTLFDRAFLGFLDRRINLVSECLPHADQFFSEPLPSCHPVATLGDWFETDFIRELYKQSFEGNQKAENILNLPKDDLISFFRVAYFAGLGRKLVKPIAAAVAPPRSGQVGRFLIGKNGFIVGGAAAARKSKSWQVKFIVTGGMLLGGAFDRLVLNRLVTDQQIDGLISNSPRDLTLGLATFLRNQKIQLELSSHFEETLAMREQMAQLFLKHARSQRSLNLEAFYEDMRQFLAENPRAIYLIREGELQASP